MEEEEEFEFYEEDAQIKKRLKIRSRGGVMTYSDMQENKRKRILREERENEEAFDPEKDAEEMLNH